MVVSGLYWLLPRVAYCLQNSRVVEIMNAPRTNQQPQLKKFEVRLTGWKSFCTFLPDMGGFTESCYFLPPVFGICHFWVCRLNFLALPQFGLLWSWVDMVVLCCLFLLVLEPVCIFLLKSLFAHVTRSLCCLFFAPLFFFPTTAS